MDDEKKKEALVALSLLQKAVDAAKGVVKCELDVVAMQKMHYNSEYYLNRRAEFFHDTDIYTLTLEVKI